jgi:hypothetical protein
MTLSKRDFVVFGAHQDSLKIMCENFWKIYNKKRFHAKIHAKIIFNQSLKEFSKKINDKYTEIKFFERENEPLTETHVQGDFVAIIVWSEEPLIFYIEDRKVAKSYKMLFKKLWKQALE